MKQGGAFDNTEQGGTGVRVLYRSRLSNAGFNTFCQRPASVHYSTEKFSTGINHELGG